MNDSGCGTGHVGKHDEHIYEDDGDGRQRQPTTAIANASTNAPRECANDGKREWARATETSPGRSAKPISSGRDST
ncbi:hypothetical protein PILCRDRAFT_4201 [Piloderma croceum F 1598]|uniref:Uncharacterized protein n=1 Tax=Piloderma croceum (strain F 1598) TaxID=765440 RepID=A0A0C3G8H9_PILCF|nr:hypothetical protein PILCRDRAFT_4201 [Piloderma croceum F 1598]